MYQATIHERVLRIRNGVRASDVPRVANRMHISKEFLVKALGFSRSAIDRKVKQRKYLPVDQAERVLGLVRLIGQVEAMIVQSGQADGFDPACWTGQWLQQPTPALGGRCPAEFSDTILGQELLSALLARMQSGAYA